MVCQLSFFNAQGGRRTPGTSTTRQREKKLSWQTSARLVISLAFIVELETLNNQVILLCQSEERVLEQPP